MKLGRESAYAIEGLLALSRKPLGTTMLLRDIAATRGVPQSFLAKIFQKLVRSGLVLSSRGAIRGYALARRPKEIKVREIILAIEGSEVFDRCLFWGQQCSESNPCLMHFRWKRLRRQVIGGLMERTTLADLAKRKAA